MFIVVCQAFLEHFSFASKTSFLYYKSMFRYYYPLFFLFFTQTAHALEALGPPTTPSGDSAYSFVRVVLGIVIKIAIPALVALIVFFAFRIVIAQGDPKTLEEAKHRFKIVLIVVAIFLTLGLIAAIIYNTGSSIGYVQLFPNDTVPIDSKFDAVMNTKLFK